MPTLLLRSPHSAFRTPLSVLRSPHSALRAPLSALRIPHSLGVAGIAKGWASTTERSLESQGKAHPATPRSALRAPLSALRSPLSALTGRCRDSLRVGIDHREEP